jgi:hypothetical protein
MTLAIIIMAGCSEDGSSNRSRTSSIDGADLIGLTSGRSLTFLQTDTILDSALSVSVTTQERTINVTGSDNDWIVNDDSQPLANLKLNDESITLNGYWRDNGGSTTLSYFAVPPVLMQRNLKKGQSWEGYTPEINLGSGNEPLAFAFCYFGFFFTKEYIGQELIQLPAGSFEAYVFEVELRRAYSDSLPTAYAHEYYDAEVGLVQLRFRGGPTNRTLSLVNSN